MDRATWPQQKAGPHITPSLPHVPPLDRTGRRRVHLVIPVDVRRLAWPWRRDRTRNRRWHRQSEGHHQRPRRGRSVRLAGAVLEERVVLRAIVDSTRLHRPLTPARLYAAVRHARFGWRLRWLLRRKRSPQLVQHALHPAQHSLARRFGGLSLPGTEAPLGFLLREDERRPAALHLSAQPVDPRSDSVHPIAQFANCTVEGIVVASRHLCRCSHGVCHRSREGLTIGLRVGRHHDCRWLRWWRRRRRRWKLLDPQRCAVELSHQLREWQQKLELGTGTGACRGDELNHGTGRERSCHSVTL
mmetsp:Transcript_791/g.2330  ORF Transcript_791/g.2330 Transcript_791/m.2330 type:complete len:301 (+) Transcript_791:185-1087(+)